MIANWDVQEVCSKNCVRVQKVMYQDIIIDHDRISGYIEECRKKCVGAELQKFLKEINGTLTFDQVSSVTNLFMTTHLLFLRM